MNDAGSWGLNLFVLFEHMDSAIESALVLEDWIYLYYLNLQPDYSHSNQFLRIEFICIIWTSVA